eukprot:NODE_2461_length_534_cov_121.888660_g1956_i0.p2 GENE.NODE_2461_length_534_cov_121.888660_g1956_i0~~NODE_2461_length_534_cov_121.888660_g1956_i0.p2  ORF type:complete len:122 (-),score=24.29 NODE_2461_length_534_cov_121.888660_g1956_i0:169-483(-)
MVLKNTCLHISLLRLLALNLLRFRLLSFRLLALCLWQENAVNGWKYSGSRNRRVRKKSAKLFVVPNRQLDVARSKSTLLVVARCVSSEFEDFSDEVFNRGREED